MSKRLPLPIQERRNRFLFVYGLAVGTPVPPIISPALAATVQDVDW